MNLTKTELDRLKGLLEELNNSAYRVKAEQEFKNDSISAFVEEIGKDRLSKKQINAMFKMYQLQEENKLDSTIEENESLFYLVERVTGRIEEVE